MPQDSNETLPSSPDLSQPSPIKQMNKLKRFLSTLFHFGSDISSDIGERVRSLIVALVTNALSVEEFHEKVQSTTNFPLRSFALPFLKSTLPHLQKDLSQLAQQSKQSTSQLLAQHEDLILLPRDPGERTTSPTVNENGKRKSSDEHETDERKRLTANHHRSSFLPTTLNSNNSLTSRREKERTFGTYLRECGPENKKFDDEWKNAENMLNYILEMATKAKRVLFLLQQKDNHLRRLYETNDFEWRRRHTELLTQTEDRIVEIRRKTEETVLEIKRQSILDLQKAVSQTEQKSTELLLREREQYQRLKAQTFEEAYTLFNRQEDGPEHCWHCGRKAIETCSGCNLARYCGQYCQHRDWEVHQKLCGPDFKRRYLENPQLHRRVLRTRSSEAQSEVSPKENERKTPEVLEKNDDQQTMKTENV